MNENLVWDALTGVQREFAELHEGAGRYVAGVAPLSAVRDWHDEQAWRDLAELAGPGQVVVLAGGGVRVPSSWRVVNQGQGLVLAASNVDSTEVGEAVVLGPADVPEMLDLAGRTGVGPLTPRAVELGTFLGTRRDGRLVSMAGERIRIPGWTEIGTVATDPDYRGQGLAGHLVRALTGVVRGRGDEAFLHVATHNTDAIRLYDRLGFTTEGKTGHIAAITPAEV
ncbi:GNAT family N-acetyltransferase [Actinoplanes solisilvae]|uniref:GNAT family N-acetyltransferase n=1 Tax=Actinoplanes solisilvae TaxID=2486853 RepID=UPI00196A6584|nr:GNAT family N-acetyltransferase [Actinoplanes solisilvae]